MLLIVLTPSNLWSDQHRESRFEGHVLFAGPQDPETPDAKTPECKFLNIASITACQPVRQFV